jgi:hypothetical protein
VIRQVAVACGLALLAVACTGNKKDGGTAGPPTTVAPTTTSAPETPEQQVLDAYRRGWQGFLAALDPPSVENPDFLRWNTGDALRDSKVYIAELQADGLVVRGTLEHNPRLVTIEGDRAVVEDCLLDRSLKYDAKTGALRDDPNPPRIGYRTEMARELGVWKHARVMELASLCA